MKSRVGKVVRVTWRDCVGPKGSPYQFRHPEDIDWEEMVPTIKSYGQVIYEDARFLIVNPHPVQTDMLADSMLAGVIVIPKKPVESVVELKEASNETQS